MQGDNWSLTVQYICDTMEKYRQINIGERLI